MKLTIKNYYKVAGWQLESNSIGCHWEIDNVYENGNDYTFHLTKRNDASMPTKTKIIQLSREGARDNGRWVYKFLPHKLHQVTPDWFSDLDNVRSAFQSEIRRIDN
jgi:hypothetical protein